MDKNRKKILLISAVTILFSFLIFLVILFNGQKSTLVALRSYQQEGSTISVIAELDPSRGAYPLEPKLLLNDVQINECGKDTVDPCYSTVLKNDKYWYFKVANMIDLQTNTLEWVDTLKQSFGAETTSIGLISNVENVVPTFERAYGRVLDQYDNLIGDALVFIDAPELDTIYVTKTAEDGTYSFILPHSEQYYLQEVSVVTMGGEEVTLRTSSDFNKPVADLIVQVKEPSEENILSELSFQSYAANSCIKSTTMGGIRAQCNEKVDWLSQLDTTTCPKGDGRFRLGMIKSTSVTQFHKPEDVKLQLVEKSTGELVKDSDGNVLTVSNGGYVDGVEVDLKDGATYMIKAYEGTTECKNTDDGDPTVLYRSPENRQGPPSGSNTGSTGNTGNTGNGTSGTGTIPPVTDEMNLCKKVGNNFAVQYRIPAEDIQKGVSLGMRWGEALITDLGGINDYKASVSDANNLGMNVILRLCYKNNCNVNDGVAYGQALVGVFNELMQSGTLPQDGLFAHAGHNEPNNAEYRDPTSEANFLIGVVNAVDSAGLLGQDLGETTIKLLSPNLDLYISQNGQWQGCSDGCDDPNPHPIYTAQSYIDEMLKVEGFYEAANKLYAWAVNDYIYQKGPDAVNADVDGFYSAFLQPRDLPGRVFITETGNYAPPGQQPIHDWSVLANTLATLESKEYVEGFLLFNALGTNRDPAFEYHKPLWDDSNLLKSLFSNCTIGSYQVPQEGEVPVTTTSGSSSNGNGSSASGGSSPPTTSSSVPFNSSPDNSAGSSSGSPGIYGSSYNGSDPCLGGICVGKDYNNYAVAVGGLLNGNMEGEFVSDGAAELNVPKYWHVWYQNGCQGGQCGIYACSNEPAFCRRPEYKQSSGADVVNRRLAGSASLQYFTTYGTHHAGVYQQVDLGLGGTNDIKVIASASSWSDDKRCEGHGQSSCVVEGDCFCEIINKFVGRVGIDPTGGIDPTASTVEWTEWKSLPNVGPQDGANFVQFEIETTSSNDRVTVFLASNNEYPYRNSDSYWDGVEMFVNDILSVGDATNSGEQQLEYNTTGGGGTTPSGIACDQSVSDITGIDACWVESQSCQPLCPDGYIESTKKWLNTDEPLPPANSCPWGRTSAQCPAGCGVIPPGDGKLGAHCCVTKCVPNWNGDFEDPRLQSSKDLLPTNSNIISQNILGATTPPMITLPTRGEYEIYAEGYMSEPIYRANFANTPLELPVFQDLDQDGEYDEGEPFAPDVSMVSIRQIGDAIQLDLSEGINLVSIPFYNEDLTSVSDIFSAIKDQGGLATSIAVYRNSGKTSGWNMYSMVGNQSYGEDFDFRPGDAMFIVIKRAVDLRLRGTSYAEPVQQYVKAGWNLIAIKGTSASYDAGRVLEEVTDLPGVQASAIAVWDSSKGSYRQFIFEGREEYGSDFGITDVQGIFLLVDNGVGYWIPSEK